ncbi:MAG TPA: Gfo/Idh/MocA family oxidoreductase [Spirochaetia bacterium]
MKVAIIGTSGHIDLALGVRDRLTGVTFVGVAPGSADEDAREFFVDQLEASLMPWYDDYRRLLDREKPDIAVVAPFFFLQSRIASECLERGIHVFVEKPMAVSLEQLERLRRAYAQGKAKLCVMLPSRYSPPFHAAWCAVQEGLIGEPLLISAQKSYKLGDRHPLYTRRAVYGGSIPWVAIHGIDWIHWFSGGGIREVVASHTARGNHEQGEMESSGACFFRLANTGCATLTFDYFRPDAARTHGDDRLRVAGDKGIVEVNGADAFLLTDAEPKRLPREEPLSLFQEFIRHVKDDVPLRLGAEDAFAITELALRCREAADRAAGAGTR